MLTYVYTVPYLAHQVELVGNIVYRDEVTARGLFGNHTVQICPEKYQHEAVSVPMMNFLTSLFPFKAFLTQYKLTVCSSDTWNNCNFHQLV
jgi:hypothetical protein